MLKLNIDCHHIGMERKPWTRESMGERMRVRGTDNTDDMATVWEITDIADTGHNNQGAILENISYQVECSTKL